MYKEHLGACAFWSPVTEGGVWFSSDLQVEPSFQSELSRLMGLRHTPTRQLTFQWVRLYPSREVVPHGMRSRLEIESLLPQDRDMRGAP